MTYATASDAARPSFVAGVSNADLAALVLRVSTGVLFLAHAGLKLFVFTPAGTAGFFESLGFPGRSPISSSRPSSWAGDCSAASL